MLFKIRNFELVKDQAQAVLTSAVAVAGTTLTVKAVDNNSWADNDWLIVGELGQANAEILQVNGAVSDGTSLTVDNAGSGGARFAHSIDEPVYHISYNQLECSRATTEAGSKTVLTTKEITPESEYTTYEDSTNTTGFGFVRFKNSTTSGYSYYSDGIPYTGYTAKSLGRMLKGVRRQLGEPDYKYITDDDIREELNEKQRDVAHERLWPFYESIRSDSCVANKRDYNISSSVSKIHAVTVKSDPVAKVDANRFNILFWDTSTSGAPTRVAQWNNRLQFYPVPDTAAAASTVSGDHTDSATAITLASTASFSPSGRVLIESEVISYSKTSSTQLLGCTRGEEGTTAAAHLSGVAVTERDIVYTAHTEPTELVDLGDETAIPDPDVLIYGAAAELAIGKLNNETLHDRLYNKYVASLDKLRDKFGRKITSALYHIRDRDTVVTDDNMPRDPNDYPVIS